MIKSIKPVHFANAFIVLSIAYYWLETTLFNPVAIGLAVVFGLHLFVAKNTAKMIFPSIFICLNLFMFLALFSELSEFTEFNKEAAIMLIVGSLYLGLNIISAIIMIKNAVPRYEISTQ